MDKRLEQSGVGVSNASPQPLFGRYQWILVALYLCLLPLIFQGYGSDNDSLSVVQAGFSTWHLHFPEMSRNPGYWTYEAIVFVLSSLGGYVLSNLASFVVGGAILWRFLRLAPRLSVAYPAILTACLVATPVFAMAATSTDDYLWSLLCLILAGEAIAADRLIAASVLGGLAISIRGANSVVLAGGFAAAIGYEIYTRRRVTPLAARIAISGICAAILGFLVYVESYRVSGGMGFTAPMIGPPEMWHFKMRAGRFVYKGLYLIGPAATLLCVIAVAMYFIVPGRRTDPKPGLFDYRLFVIAWGFALADVGLFFKFPVEISYLLPALFFLLLIGGATIFRRSIAIPALLFLCILSLNFIEPRFAEPNVPGRATDARIRLSLKRGEMLDDVAQRHRLIPCHDVPCWNQVLRPGLPY